jgi:hypothetical protein
VIKRLPRVANHHAPLKVVTADSPHTTAAKRLSPMTLMHRAQLWTVFAPTPAPVGTGAGRTVHNYWACRNFLEVIRGLIAAHFRTARCVPALGQMMLETISIGHQLAIAKPVRRIAGKSSCRVHCGLLRTTTPGHRRNCVQFNPRLSRKNPAKPPFAHAQNP